MTNGTFAPQTVRFIVVISKAYTVNACDKAQSLALNNLNLTKIVSKKFRKQRKGPFVANFSKMKMKNSFFLKVTMTRGHHCANWKI